MPEKKEKETDFELRLQWKQFLKKKDYFGVCILGGWGKEVAKAECGCLDTNGQKKREGGSEKGLANGLQNFENRFCLIKKAQLLHGIVKTVRVCIKDESHFSKDLWSLNVQLINHQKK